MPLASFRSFAGVAKDTIETFLTAPVAAGATSIPVNGTNVVAGSTIFFVDGPNSESKAVTSGGGTSTLTVTATTNAHSQNCFIYAQPTASVGPVDYIPLTSFDFQDDITQLADQGLRGSNVEQYGSQQGIIKGTVNIGGDVIPDTFGYLLGSIFGAVDFAGGTPNTHTFAGMNTQASNGQPTPLIWYDNDAYNQRAFPGAKATDLNIKLDPKGLVTWTSKSMTFPSIVVPTSTPTYSTLTPQGAWQVSATVGGTSVPGLLSADVSIKRQQADAIHTLQGVQTPLKIWSGALVCTGTLNFVMEDDTQLLNYLNNSQPAVVLKFTNGTGAAQVGLTIQMTKCNFLSGWKPKQTGTQGYVEMGGPFNAISNTTDANTAGGGYSPCRVVLSNNKASGTYQ